MVDVNNDRLPVLHICYSEQNEMEIQPGNASSYIHASWSFEVDWRNVYIDDLPVGSLQN